jgi:hypothetical protein
VTLDNKFIVKASKCAGLAKEIGFFFTKFVQFAMAGKRCNEIMHPSKRV